MIKVNECLREGHNFKTITGNYLYYMSAQNGKKLFLPHAHTLFWFDEKMRPHVGSVVSAGLPDLAVGQELHNIIKKTYDSRPCGVLSVQSLYIKDSLLSTK